MLEFIVLGIVPGTGWQLNLMSVLLLWAGLSVLVWAYSWYHRRHKLVGIYELSVTYFMLVTRKHLITRRLNRLA